MTATDRPPPAGVVLVTDPHIPAGDGPGASPSRWRAPRWSRHEWLLAVVGGLLLAVVLTWPTLRHPWTTIPGDLGDPTLQAWQVAWGGHALLTNPLGLWESNTFYPAPYTFAYSDTLLGYAPAGFFGTGEAAAVLRYNLLYVLLHALAFVGAYALVRQLGAGRVAALVAGVAWAFSPWRLAHSGHLNILSTGGIALCLAMLARGHGWSLRRGYRPQLQRPGWAFAGWLVAAWQVSLGFGIGLPLVYFLLATGLVAAVGYVWSWRVRGRRPAFGRRLLVADVCGGLVFAGLCVWLGTVFLHVVELNPQARRDLSWTQMFSPPLQGYFVPPADSWLWGDRFASARTHLSWPAEMALFPGATLIVLAFIGLVYSSFRVRHRVLLALGVLGTGALGLGSNLGDDGEPGYLTLSKLLPGWDALRTPGRLMVWTSLLLAVLAAGAITALTDHLRKTAPPETAPATEAGAAVGNHHGAAPSPHRPPMAATITATGSRLRAATPPQPPPAAAGASAEPEAPDLMRRWASYAALLLVVVLVFVEGINRTAHPVVPPAPVALSSVPEPLLVLPSDSLFELHVMLWSTDGFPRIANGLAAFVPASQDQIRKVTAAFPDPASVAYLRQIGIQSVVIMPDQLAGTPWEGAADRPVNGLGITRDAVGGVLVYRLGSSPG